MIDQQTPAEQEPAGTPSMPDPAHPELAAGADPSNTPVEDITEELEDDDAARQRLGMRGESTIAEHTDEALVLRQATDAEMAGEGSGANEPDGGEAATGAEQ
jgi:hypothetical protein